MASSLIFHTRQRRAIFLQIDLEKTKSLGFSKATSTRFIIPTFTPLDTFKMLN